MPERELRRVRTEGDAVPGQFGKDMRQHRPLGNSCAMRWGDALLQRGGVRTATELPGQREWNSQLRAGRERETRDCCASLEVDGGMYNRTYTNTGTGPTGAADPATVSSFRLDKYLVTVGRFRQYVNYVTGSTGAPPENGSGIHTHLNGGLGLANSGNPGTYEDGLGWGGLGPVHRDGPERAEHVEHGLDVRCELRSVAEHGWNSREPALSTASTGTRHTRSVSRTLDCHRARRSGGS